MRRYETIFIIDNDLAEEDHPPIFEKLNDLIKQYNGLAILFDEWGTRKLAYEIKKKIRGYYVRLDYCGSGTLVNEIERFFRIDDRVLKYMTVLLDKDVDMEAVKEEISRSKSEKDASDSSDQDASEPVATPDDQPGEASGPEPLSSDAPAPETSADETTPPNPDESTSDPEKSEKTEKDDSTVNLERPTSNPKK